MDGSSSGEDQQPQLSSLLDGSLNNRGILCNDPTGLCLASQGNIDSQNAGAYTNLVRLASQLPEASAESPKNTGASIAPLITVEYESHALIIKEYDGHVVALRVPTTKNSTSDSTRSVSTSEVGAVDGVSFLHANSNDSVESSS